MGWSCPTAKASFELPPLGGLLIAEKTEKWGKVVKFAGVKSPPSLPLAPR